MRTLRVNLEGIGFDGDVDVFRWDVSVGVNSQQDGLLLIEEFVRWRRGCIRVTRGHRQVGNWENEC